jgi:hypothetical protein
MRAAGQGGQMYVQFSYFGVVEAPEGSEVERILHYEPLEWKGRKPLVERRFEDIEARVYRSRTREVRILEVACPIGGWTERGRVYWPLRFLARWRWPGCVVRL